jgi:hypothetical protein
MMRCLLNDADEEIWAVDIMGRFILWSSPTLLLRLVAGLEATAAGFCPSRRARTMTRPWTPNNR